jgi:hypothetical protein
MADCAAKGRNAFAQRTHCPQGHPYDEANTRRDKRGSRQCRACERNRMRRVLSIPPERWRSKAHCFKGHPYDEANTYIDSRNRRNCRACKVQRERRRRERLRNGGAGKE